MLTSIRYRLPFRGIYVGTLALLGANICFSAAMVTICQVALLLNWLLEGSLKQKLSRFLSNKLALSISGIYFLHILGLLYSSDWSYGLFDLKVKLPLLLLPLIMGSTEPLDNREWNYVLKAFLAGIGLLTIYSMFIYWGYTGVDIHLDNTTYSRTNLRYMSPFISHIRYTLMIALSIYISGYFAIKEPTTKARILWALLCIWLILFLSIMGVRISMIAALVVSLFLALRALFILKNKVWGIALIVILTVTPFLIYHEIPGARTGISEALWEIDYYNKGGDPSGHSIPQRFEYWKMAAQLIQKEPLLGVGSGDIKETIQHYYDTQTTRLSKEAQNRPHNEYLSICVSMGFIGLACFIALLLFPVFYRYAWRSRLLFMCFWLILITSMLTEDTIETQAGVTFVAFFASVLLLSEEWKKPIEQ